MKTISMIIFFVFAQISIFGQKHYTYTFTSITPYGQVMFTGKATKVGGRCIFSKITFLPNKDSLQSLYILNLYQKLSTGLLDSIILNLKPLKKSRSQTLLTMPDYKNFEWYKINHFPNILERVPNKQKPFMGNEYCTYKSTIIQKDKYDASNLYYIHFKEKVKPQNFDKTIEGVEAIWQQSPERFSENKHQYTIIVEIGRAFDELEILKKIINSKK